MRPLNIHALLFACMFTAGAVQLFEKHYNRKIAGNITASIPVKGALDCEKVCLGMDADCYAVNVIYTKHEYVCDIMATFPYSEEEVESQMRSSPKDKLIIFRGSNMCTEPGTTCVASSTFRNQPCEHAIDGVLAKGGVSEWYTRRNNEGEWIKITFPNWVIVVKLQVWPRCAKQDQFRTFSFEFSDNSMRQGSIECTNNTDWGTCPDPGIFEDIYLSEPKKTRWITLTGLEVCIDGGHAGFREVLYMGKFAS